MKSILFVCTGNIFRSMTAEYALKATWGSNAAYRVSSAGTKAVPQMMAPFVKVHLHQRGLNPDNHRQRKVTAAMLDEADLIVAMGLDHREDLRQQFQQEALLFNQICFGREEPVLDIWEAVPNWQQDEVSQEAYAISVIDHICEAMPLFIKNIERF